MIIMCRIPEENGGYSVMQSWSLSTVPEGYVKVPGHLDTSVFYEYNGFVTLTIEKDVVVGMEPNVAAWEAWKASLPETTDTPTISTEELLLEMAVDHEARICAMELGV